MTPGSLRSRPPSRLRTRCVRSLSGASRSLLVLVLAAALAEAGRHAEAAEMAERGVTLLEEKGKAGSKRLQDARAQLETYRAGQAFRVAVERE